MAEGQVDLMARREANVLLELSMEERVSEQVLDGYSEAVMESLAESAGDIALGPAVALNMESSTIKVRFDVLGEDNAAIHRQVSEILSLIERDTELVLSRSSVAA